MGQEDMESPTAWSDSIVATLKGAGKDGGDSETKRSLPMKKLRKMVLLSLQMDESDKKAKKAFKKSVQSLEVAGRLSLDKDGVVTLIKKRKSKGENKKRKKKRRTNAEIVAKETTKLPEHLDPVDGDNQSEEPITSGESSERNKPCKGNPQGITRLFLGNLPFAVDETSLGEFLPGTVTHIKWITDQTTGKFYGSAFCEMGSSVDAAEAVSRAGSELMGRPIKINFAPARPGDVWPPEKKVVSGGGGKATEKGVKPMSAKPENCQKLFIGNLSYDIDDDALTKFFANVDAEVKAIRWLHHKDSGDFKGCGFVDFWNAEACEKAATLNGKNLLGRPIRIDWTE